MQYLVTWQIQVDAESPEDAARAALEIQRDPESQATFFYVEEDDDGLIPMYGGVGGIIQVGPEKLVGTWQDVP